jgi:hypothetical protein
VNREYREAMGMYHMIQQQIYQGVVCTRQVKFLHLWVMSWPCFTALFPKEEFPFALSLSLHLLAL